MGECKTKAIQTYLGSFKYNKTYPGIIQACLEPCVILTYLKLRYIQNPDTFTTLVYSEPRYIQNAGTFEI